MALAMLFSSQSLHMVLEICVIYAIANDFNISSIYSMGATLFISLLKYSKIGVITVIMIPNITKVPERRAGIIKSFL